MMSVSTTPIERKPTDWEEKFRATRIWNECVRTFRSSMPLRRHRRQLKNYDDTFSAAEAVDWLLTYLVTRPDAMSRGKRMCRENALELLKQLHNHGVFEVARTCDRKPDLADIRDDDVLYKFTSTPVDDLVRTPLALKNQRLQKSRSTAVVQAANTSPLKPAAVVEPRVRQNRRSATPMKYRKLSSSPRAGETVAKRRLLLDSTQSAPVAGTPEEGATARVSLRARASSAGKREVKPTVDLPAYCWVDAIVHRLSQLIAVDEREIRELLSTIDVDAAQVKWNCEMAGSCGITQANNRQGEVPRHVIRMMRYVTRWPFAAGDTAASLYNCAYVGIERDVFANVCAYFYDRQPALDAQFVALMLALRDRLVELAKGRCAAGAPAVSEKRSRAARRESGEKTSAVSLNRTRSFSANAPSQRSDGSSESLEQLRYALSRLPGLLRSPSVLRRMNAYTEHKLAARAAAAGGTGVGDSSSALRAVLPSVDGKRRADGNGVDDRSLYFTPPEEPGGSESEWGNMEIVIEVYQLLLLLLPTVARITLQYVTRFMHRAANNRCLKLDGSNSENNRSVLLERLTRSVLCASDCAAGPTPCVRLAALLVEHEPRVLCPAPAALHELAGRMQRHTVQFADPPVTPVAFCERISDEEWHKQKEAESPLLKLLDAIVADENVDSKQKRAKLKKFRTEYPAVYARRFPPAAAETTDAGGKGAKPPVPPGAAKRPSMLRQLRTTWKK